MFCKPFTFYNPTQVNRHSLEYSEIERKFLITWFAVVSVVPRLDRSESLSLAYPDRLKCLQSPSPFLDKEECPRVA